MAAPRIGLVLAGGGVAGYGFHAGVLATLEARTGWDARSAEIIVGTSSGSIVAAILRADIGAAELRRRVVAVGPGAETDAPLEAVAGPGSFRIPRLWRGPAAPGLLLSELRRGRNLRASNLVVGALPTGRLPTTPLRAVVEPMHETSWPDKQLWIPVTDLQSGHRVVLGRDDTDLDVATAVEASCAIPGYFAPVEIGGRRYIDGGMRSPDNADLLIGLGLDLVIVLSPLSAARYARRSPLLSMLRAYPRRRLRVNVEELRGGGTAVLVMEPDHDLAKTMGINAMSPERLRPIVDAAGDLANRKLAGLDEPDQRLLSLLTSTNARHRSD